MIKGFFIAAPSVVRVSEKFSLGVKVLGDVYDCPPACYYPKQKIPQQKGRFNLSPRGIIFKDHGLPEWRGSTTIEAYEINEGPIEY